MPRSPLRTALVARALLAAGLLFIVAGIAGAHLAPTLPMHRVLLYAAAGTVVLLALLVIVAVVSLTLAQFVLRKGGTDAQWFWFRDEPPGLKALRARARASQSPSRK